MKIEIGIFSGLTLLLIGLKLGKVIDWSWWLVLMPIWIMILFYLFIFVLIMLWVMK